LPRRWVVERFFAWINRNRRLAKDFEATTASATAFLYAAPSCCSLDASLANHEFRDGLLEARICRPKKWPWLVAGAPICCC
jgi:hypothetical protein